MSEAHGTVAGLDGDHAIVRMDEAGCGRCHEEGGCGGHNLGNLLCRTPRTFRVPNPGRSRIGDRVVVCIAEGAVRRSALRAYGLPLLSLLLGAVIGSLLGGDVGAIGGAVGGLLLAWQGLRHVQRRSVPDPRSQPYIRY